MKLIEIDCCFDCPYFGHDSTCFKLDKVIIVNPIEAIHPDCPLPDSKPEAKYKPLVEWAEEHERLRQRRIHLTVELRENFSGDVMKKYEDTGRDQFYHDDKLPGILAKLKGE